MAQFHILDFKFHDINNRWSENRRQNRVSSIQKPATGSQKPEASRQSAAGFTLMEILVATAILAIVVTTVLASFNAVFSPPELDQPPDPYRFVASVQDTGGTGFAKNLRFASRAHVGFEKSSREGIAEIIYYVQARDDGHLALKRADNLYPYPVFEERGSDPVLCKYVKSLSFKFYDKDGIEFDVWDSDSDEFGYATPKAIGIKLELANRTASQTFETMVSLPISRDPTE
jgi:general secretion pathway protein J